MGRYASKTTVPVEKSRGEIESTLARYGATHFAYAMLPDKAMIEFVAENRRVRFILPLAPRDERGWEQRHRQKWRALLLCIKSKLETVESGIGEFESEFMANIVMPNNETVGQWMQPQIEQAYQTKQMPPLLLDGPSDHQP